MEKLLPYFERELGMLRRASQEFAGKYPKLADKLSISGETCADPHVERLIQASAFLNARIAKLLDDDYEQFTEALLGMLYPHYLRPIPSCAIARVDYSGAKPNEIGAATTIPRGTEMKSLASATATCKFKTVFDVSIAPIAFGSVHFAPFVVAPPSLRLPSDALSSISIVVDATSAAHALDKPGQDSLRIFIEGDPSLRAALRDALFMHASCAFMEAGADWTLLDQLPLRQAGFADGEALLPFRASEHPAYRLLSEYFSFPEKFDFVDLDLAALRKHCPPDCRRLTLHLALNLRADAHSSRLLRSLSASNMVLGCTPIVNLFQHAASPIKLSHARSSYPLVPDQLPGAGSDIYSVDSVQLLRKSAAGSAVTEFVPFYSLRHGESPSKKGHYWLLRRDAVLSAAGKGHEFALALVDRDFSPLKTEASTLSISLTCTNRNLPRMLASGMTGGDLSTEIGAAGYPIRLLHKPTVSRRLSSGRGTQWGLIAHLALNHRSLTSDGLAAFTAMLRLYALPDDAVAQRQIDGIVDLGHRPASAWLRRREGAAYLYGIEVRVTLDEDAYAGTGIHLFAQLLDHFFGLYVHLNSYTQLVVLSKSSGRELLRCQPRNGALTLA
jgi:type VI secretion system protein ImpG